jgi:Na+/H+ antiporter NhaC
LQRRLVLIAVLAFIAVLAALTVDDVIVYGLNLIDVISVIILGFFSVAIVGSLLSRPPDE